MKSKIILLTFLLFVFCFSAKAQFKVKNHNTNHSPLYIGIGTGINASSGAIGFKFNYELTPKLMLDAGLGIGTWGYKQTINLLYITKPENGWNPGIGISRGGGVDTASMDIEALNLKNNIVGTYYLQCELKNMFAMNFMVQKQWYTKSKNRLALDLGIAISMKNQVDPVRSKDLNYVVTTKGQNNVLMAAPGGLIAGFSYNFKL